MKTFVYYVVLSVLGKYLYDLFESGRSQYFFVLAYGMLLGMTGLYIEDICNPPEIFKKIKAKLNS